MEHDSGRRRNRRTLGTYLAALGNDVSLIVRQERWLGIRLR